MASSKRKFQLRLHEHNLHLAINLPHPDLQRRGVLLPVVAINLTFAVAAATAAVPPAPTPGAQSGPIRHAGLTQQTCVDEDKMKRKQIDGGRRELNIP